MPRKSAAQREADAISAKNFVAPPPPADFTERHATLWNALFERHGIFDEDQWPMLETYVRCSVSAHYIGKVVAKHEASDEIDQKEYNEALRMREREARLIASLGLRLGIAKGTDRNGAKIRPSATPTKKPWE